MGGIYFRMILWELTKVFLISLVGITGILLMAGIIAEASQQGLAPGQIMAAIPLLVPSTLPYTIPATTLFACCVVYGRLAGDNEILAIRASGVNLVHVVWPGVVLGLIMSAATMGLYYRIIPYTHHLLRAMVFHDAEELLYTLLRKQGAINHSQSPFAMYVRGVQGRRLLSPIFTRRDARGQIDVWAVAKEADLRVNIAKRQLLIRMRWGAVTFADGSFGYFDDKTWEVPLPDNFGVNSILRARDMTWQEILERRRDYYQQIDQWEQEAEEAEDPQHARNLRDKAAVNRQQILYLDVELLMRPALSLGCLCFIMVGCPVGIWFSRSDFLSSFITCFLPIVIIYYPLMLCGTGMAKEGKLDPAVLVWAADGVIGTIGLLLFARLLKN